MSNVKSHLKMSSALTRCLIVFAVLQFNPRKVECTHHCEQHFYEPVSDCIDHSLRIGYYGNNECGSQHTLSDSDSRPNAGFARLDHPASYVSSGQTKYYEYAAGLYLSVKLSREAEIHAIAIQGSPNSMRYYLKSFKISHGINVNNLDMSQPPVTTSEYYKESGVIKEFHGNMQKTTKFILTNPFYADEIRVYPLLFEGDRAFRMELYGCYLGKVMAPVSVGMGHPAMFVTRAGQTNTTLAKQHYLNVKEPNGTLNLVQISNTVNYTFISRGIGTVKLGIKHASGWISVDEITVTVQGPILDLKLRLGVSIAADYKTMEGSYVQFQLLVPGQPYQIKRAYFVFGDGTNCEYNYCMKNFTRGVYVVNGTALNDFYQASQFTTVVACPNTPVSITYNPVVNTGGNAIRYNGAHSPHNFTVTFYALYNTTYEVRWNGVLTHNEALSGNGWTNRIISFPNGIIAPSQHNLIFNYTDFCEPRVFTAAILVDEEVAGLSVRLNQTFKEGLTIPVAYFFKNKPVHLYIDVASGTSVSCTITISDPIPTSYSMVPLITDKVFLKTYTFSSPGDTFPSLSATCSNRPNLRQGSLSTTQFDFRQIPEALTNFTISLSKNVISTVESVTLRMEFQTGTHMNCTVNSTTAGILQTYLYSTLLTSQTLLPDSRKRYIVSYSNLPYSPSHRIDVMCRSVTSIVSDTTTLEVQIPVSGLSLVGPDSVCFFSEFTLESKVAQGKPVTKELLVDSVKKSTQALLTDKDSSFVITFSDYGSAGLKTFSVNIWNTVTSVKQTVSKQIRISQTITSLDIEITFTISSPQALPSRPYLILPINEVINFKALIEPVDVGYLYNFSIIGPSTSLFHSTTSPTYAYTFASTGTWQFRLIADGCNDKLLERNVTVVGPISDFSLSINPAPESVVNKTTNVRATYAAQAYCLELDFGDGSDSMKNCKNNTDAHPLNCFQVGEVCSVDHVYRRNGVYTVRFIAKNDLFKLMKESTVTAKSCFNPGVEVAGDGYIFDGDHNYNPTFSQLKHLRSRPLTFNASAIEMNCDFSSTYSISWTAFFSTNVTSYKDVNRSDSALILSNDAFTFRRANHELSVPCCFLPYGMLSVSVVVRVSGNVLTDSFKTSKIFNAFIWHTEPVAMLEKTDFRFYGYNTMIRVNATKSHDPDGYSTNLQYAWYCRDVNLEPRDISTVSVLPLLNSTVSLPHPVTGCFGSPVGRINVESFASSVEFNSKLLQENHTIEITVVVSNSTSIGVRESNISTTFLVLTKETPYLEISCVENCLAKVNPRLKMTLNVQCYGDVCMQNPDYKWTMFKENTTHNTSVELDSKLHSFDFEKDLRMKPNALEVGTRYKLVLRGTGIGGAYYVTSYTFVTSITPWNGTCSVSPSIAVAIFQSIVISCTEWIDDNLPLSYEMAIVDDISAHILCKSANEICSTVIPDGFQDNSTLIVRTRIYNSLDVYTDVFQNIKVFTSSCNSELYGSSTDCDTRPLRIGNYDRCGNLHFLMDSENNPNANFARLNHPAFFNSKFHEYVAGEYLQLTLANTVYIHGIALQGSPDSLRYYLKSFELSYRTVVNSLNDALSSSVVSNFYKENGIKKVFTGDMNLATKFTFKNPFYSDRISIYPLTYHENKVFRVELFGCQLGKLDVSKPIVVNTSTAITIKHTNSSAENMFYVKITELKGTSSILNITNMLRFNFTSYGKARIELGLKYNDGWISIDFQDVNIFGPISGLTMLMDGYSLTPYKRINEKSVHFSIEGISDPAQITGITFEFGDSSTCAKNNCIKELSHGLYNVSCIVSNSFYHQRLQGDVISCPLSVLRSTYTPSVFQGGIGIDYKGVNATHFVSVRFFAVWVTNFKAYFDGVEIQNKTLIGKGWNNELIHLPTALLAPSSHSLIFNYTDACGYRNESETIYIDEMIQGLSLQVNQAFKSQLIEQVSNIFKNHSVDFIFKIESGTTVSCNYTIHEFQISSAKTINFDSKTINVLGKQFMVSKNFTSIGHSDINITCVCWNRLNQSAVELPVATINVRRVPESMTNFSVDVSKKLLTSGEVFQLFLFFKTGEEMSCNITLNSTQLTKSYSYEELLSRESLASDSRKSYSINVTADAVQPQLLLDVTCKNVLHKVNANITVSVTPVSIDGLSINVDTFLCHGSPIGIRRNVTKGSPIYDTVYIDGNQVLQLLSFEHHSQFTIPSSLYGATGLKNITLKASNSANALDSPRKQTKISLPISTVDVLMNFSLSSSQGLVDRPSLILPIGDMVNFTAVVYPSSNEYVYKWSLGNITNETQAFYRSFSFPNNGIHLFQLTVIGCNTVVFERNLTVISPIESFDVKANPHPECIVGKATTITITYAHHGDCLDLDFGDGSPRLSQCKTSTPLKLNCFTNGSVCIIDHVYNTSGTYKITVIARNQLFARLKEVTVTAKACSNPVIIVHGDGTESMTGFRGLSESIVVQRHYRSKPVSFNLSTVSVNCEFSLTYSIHWQVFSLKINSTANKSTLLTDGHSFLVPNSTILFENGDHRMTIPCCMVNYGDLIVYVEVRMTGHYLIGDYNTSKVFATVIHDTELVADLNVNRNYAYNETIVLNATLSRDPDGFSNLTYIWYCRDTSKESRDIFSIPNLPMIGKDVLMMSKGNTPNSSILSLNQTVGMMLQPSGTTVSLSPTLSSVTTQPSSVSPNSSAISGSSSSGIAYQEQYGCFGASAGILDVPRTVKEVSFNSMHLVANRTIEFSVLIEATNPLRKRRSNTSRALNVFLPLTPIFELRCTDNCKTKLDPFHKFSLVTICKRGTCESNSTFKWRMEQFNHTSRQIVNLNNYLYGTDESKNLYMKQNVLTPGFNYSLVLKATASDGSYYEKQYSIEVNIQPLNGTCILDPSEGLAVYTIFNISCTGWVDTELPMTYEVAHVNDVLTTVVCRQHDGSCQTRLPIVASDTVASNVLLVRIRIIDSMGMFTEIFYNVTVHHPNLNVEMMSEALLKLDNLTGLEAAQYIGAIASVFNYESSVNRTANELGLKTQFRDKAMSLVMKMINTSSDDVIAPLIALLSEVPGEFSSSSAALSTNGLNTMVYSFLQEEHDVIFRDVVSRAKSLLAGMGMVMKSTSINLDPNQKSKNETNFTENPLRWTTVEGRRLVLVNSGNTESLVNAILGRMSPVEEAVKIVTSNLGISLEVKEGDKMNETTQINLMEGQIILPSLNDMNLNDKLVISSVTKLTTFNSYFWEYTSKLINSSTIDFHLKSDTSSLSVMNTKQPILMSIPRKLEKPMAYHHWTFNEQTGKEKSNFHNLKVEHDNSLHVEFKPMNYCIDYEVFIKYEAKPSRDQYYKNWTLPDLSTCGDTRIQEEIRANICIVYQKTVAQLNTFGTNGTEPNINCTLMEQLEASIKELVQRCILYPYRLFLLDSETKNGTYVYGIYEKNGTISPSIRPSELLNATTNCQLVDGVNQSTYFIRTFTSKCRFWNTRLEQWENSGCQVGEETNATSIQCKCNHLTSFAGDFFVAPNPIHMDKVIEGFKNIQDNVSVVVLLSLLIGLFILLIVRLRKLDKLDSSMVGVVAVEHDPCDTYEYLVVTITGARINAGTTANVFCALNSSERKGEPRILVDLENSAFQRDQINAFKISYKEPFGDITDIRIWHDNKGDNPSWYLSRVYIEDLQTNKTFTFICEQWLAVEFEDGLIDRSIGVANQEDYKVFTHMFTTKTAKDFSDQHLWLSLFLKRPHDSFTRVQRTASCMALLFLTMLASAMFFQLDNQTKHVWKIGSLVIDFKGVIIGIQSGFIAIPISAIILSVFRNTESFEQYKTRRRILNRNGTTAKRTKLLPCGFLIVAWFLAICAIAGSAIIVLFYSMQWGNDKSRQFVISVFTSFLQSAFIIQPLKLVILAIILAAIFKRNQEESDVLAMYKLSSNVHILKLSENDIEISKIQPKPLTEEQQKFARKRRLMEIKLNLFMRELISYLVFLIFLGLVMRGYRDNDAYDFSKTLQDDIVHNHFQRIKDIPAVWSWVQNHFIPAIYTQQWYNDNNFSTFKMTRNQEAYRIGLARIRQLRVKENSCKVPDDFQGIINRCNAAYNFENDEERDFDIGWKNITNSKRKRRGIHENEVTEDRFNLGITMQNMLKYMKKLDVEAEMNKDDWSFEDMRHRGYAISYAHKGNDGKTKKVHQEDTRNVQKKDEQTVLKSFDLFHSKSLISPFERLKMQITTDDYDIPRINFFEGSSQNSVSDFEGGDGYETLSRTRRALKFKIKRKTIPSTSSLSHPDAVTIDERYLLPNGLIKPNKDNWIYHDMSSLRGFPYYGHFATYSGGGYVASLSTDIDYARATAMALEQDSWVDMLTRAIFFEFSVYNANLNFFATGFIIVEVLPTGSIVPSANIRVFKLYRYVGLFGRVVMASEIILVLCLLFFIYKECRHMYRLGCAYFKLFWSWVEIIIAIALFTAIILRAFSWYEADKNLMKLRQSTEQFINFHYTVVADDALLTAIMVISFFSTIKVIKIIDIFPTIVSLKGTFRRCMKPLINYALPFTIAFCAFGALSHLLFHETTMFMSYLNTAETQLLMLVGGSVYYTLYDAHAILGPLFFLLFAAFETFLLLNVFLSIINEGISEERYWKGEINANEFYKFIEERAFHMIRSFTIATEKTTATPYLDATIKSEGTMEMRPCSGERKGFSEESTVSFNEEEAFKEDMKEVSDLTMKKLENRFIENYEIEEEDAQYFFKLLVSLRRKKTKTIK